MNILLHNKLSCWMLPSWTENSRTTHSWCHLGIYTTHFFLSFKMLGHAKSGTLYHGKVQFSPGFYDDLTTSALDKNPNGCVRSADVRQSWYTCSEVCSQFPQWHLFVACSREVVQRLVCNLKKQLIFSNTNQILSTLFAYSASI